jgi:hypothetical protein
MESASLSLKAITVPLIRTDKGPPNGDTDRISSCSPGTKPISNKYRLTSDRPSISEIIPRKPLLQLDNLFINLHPNIENDFQNQFIY